MGRSAVSPAAMLAGLSFTLVFGHEGQEFGWKARKSAGQPEGVCKWVLKSAFDAHS
jgi:hypothetical protein